MKQRNNKAMESGFTLLEILLVVAAIAILAGIVIIAINPGKQLGDTRNAQRRVDVNTIINGIYQYAIDNDGDLPGPGTIATDTVCPGTGVSEICTTGGTCTGLLDLSSTTAGQVYLVAMPTDPTATTTNGTGYNVIQSANGRVTVCAPGAEQGASISVTR